MNYQPPLPWFELARFTRHRLTRAALLAVAMVPLFYGAMFVWANWDPYEGLGDVPAAIVNHDEIVFLTDPDGNEMPVAVGRLLAGELISSDIDGNFDWVLTDEEDAESGLVEGRYAAVLTIPSNLSEAAISTAGDDPMEAVAGIIQMRTNDADNYVNGTVIRAISEATLKALNAQVVETYLDNIFLGFNSLYMALSEAADGAAQIADGAGQLSGGALQLADGNRQLADGVGQVADGTSQLSSGAGQLADGNRQLADGLGEAAGMTATLPRDTRLLADGARQVADGNQQLADEVAAIVAVIEQVTGEVTGRIDAIQATLLAVADECDDAGIDPALCGPLRDFANDTDALIALISEPARQAGELRDATAQLADGANQVAGGAEQLADGLPALVDGLAEASNASSQLASGSAQLFDGVRQLDGGVQELHSGALMAADGAEQLAGGAGELADGTSMLADGLAEGRDEVPNYSDEERAHLASIAASPFADDVSRMNAVQSYGAALAPYFTAIGLWVGAIAIFLLMNAIPPRALASTAASWRVTLAGLLPAGTLSIIQAALLVGLFIFIMGLTPAQPWLFLGFAVLAGITFTAINQALVGFFGPAGRFIALIFVSVQVAAAGGVFPIESSPAPFQFIHNLIPLTHAVDGMRIAVAGGSHGITTAAIGLLAWLVIAVIVTTIAATRQRMVTLEDLYPPLRPKA